VLRVEGERRAHGERLGEGLLTVVVVTLAEGRHGAQREGLHERLERVEIGRVLLVQGEGGGERLARGGPLLPGELGLALGEVLVGRCQTLGARPGGGRDGRRGSVGALGGLDHAQRAVHGHERAVVGLDLSHGARGDVLAPGLELHHDHAGLAAGRHGGVGGRDPEATLMEGGDQRHVKERPGRYGRGPTVAHKTTVQLQRIPPRTCPGRRAPKPSTLEIRASKEDAALSALLRPIAPVRHPRGGP
jgi:hypothetical protein